ncbi:MAG TPA: hypothetical protein VK849_15700 [Longimicrobiales bacterium]|nr:hypothetical protein [Longimicrobiales bacterium]
MFPLLLGCALLACGPAGDAPAASGRAPDVTITGEPVCPDCEIVLEDVALLGDPADPSSTREDAAGRGCMVGRLSDGSFVSSGAVGGGRLHVFGPAGQVVRTIGRPGQGPGELGPNLRLWVGADDTLFVVDEGNARLQVMTPSGAYVRSFTLPARYRPFARLRGGDFLFHRTPTGPDDRMFHQVDPTGRPLSSFGEPELAEYDLESWLVAPASSGGFWLASMWRYTLYRRASADSVVWTVRREADWFPGGVWWTEGLYVEDPPGPHLIRMHEDPSGLLWVYAGVADADWRPNEVRIPDPEWYRANFDVVVEVLDPARASVVARARVDYMLGEVCGSDLMYTVTRAADGDTRIRVVRPRLRGYAGAEDGVP